MVLAPGRPERHRPSTVEALIAVEGHHGTASTDSEAALADLASLLASHQPRIEQYLLTPTNPSTAVGRGIRNPGR